MPLAIPHGRDAWTKRRKHDNATYGHIPRWIYHAAVGFGGRKASNQEVVTAIEAAPEAGYRSIDTAAIYKNEEGVGQALQGATVARQDLFITTKLWNGDQTMTQKAIEQSLSKLRLDYVDLYLMHWPVPSKDNYVQAWRDMVKLKEEGLAKSIGVCNCEPHHLQRLLDETGVVPVINQIELHPLLQQQALRNFAAQYQILTESWSPLSRGGKGVFDHAIIRELADKYGKTPAQIVIRWHIDNALVVIPKSVTPARIRANFDVFDFSLTQDDLDAIATLDSGKRLGSQSGYHGYGLKPEANPAPRG